MLLDDHREEVLPSALGQLAVRGDLRACLIDGEGLDQQPDAHARDDVGNGVMGQHARQLPCFGRGSPGSRRARVNRASMPRGRARP